MKHFGKIEFERIMGRSLKYVKESPFCESTRFGNICLLHLTRNLYNQSKNIQYYTVLKSKRRWKAELCTQSDPKLWNPEEAQFCRVLEVCSISKDNLLCKQPFSSLSLTQEFRLHWSLNFTMSPSWPSLEYHRRISCWKVSYVWQLSVCTDVRGFGQNVIPSLIYCTSCVQSSSTLPVTWKWQISFMFPLAKFFLELLLSWVYSYQRDGERFLHLNGRNKSPWSAALVSLVEGWKQKFPSSYYSIVLLLEPSITYNNFFSSNRSYSRLQIVLWKFSLHISIHNRMELFCSFAYWISHSS